MLSVNAAMAVRITTFSVLVALVLCIATVVDSAAKYKDGDKVGQISSTV